MSTFTFRIFVLALKIIFVKFIACVLNVPFFSDASTWCHKVHSKYVENACFCNNICYDFKKDIAFFYHDIAIICVHHEILHHNMESLQGMLGQYVVEPEDFSILAYW